MRVFKYKGFLKFARKEHISDRLLCDAVRRAESGLIDADLGGGVVKLRLPRPGQGRSGSYRSIVLFRSGVRAVFVYGYAKNEQSDISSADLSVFRNAAKAVSALSPAGFQKYLNSGEIIEVRCDGNEKV